MKIAASSANQIEVEEVQDEERSEQPEISEPETEMVMG